MSTISRKLTFTILSMSLLTVMAGAAIAPALGVISQHFSNEHHLLVQFIVSMPALFIIITNLFFSTLCRFIRTRAIAIIGLLLYVVAGAGAFFAENIGLILVLRGLLGVSVGMIMPLSTGLLSYYFPPEEQARLMGLSAAMNQMGGVVATLLAGLLCTIHWNYAFLVYLLGLIALILVIAFLPNERLIAPGGKVEPKTLLRFHPSVIGMLLLMSIFFVFPTNFAITTNQTTTLNANEITFIMVGLDVVAFFVGLVFSRMMQQFRNSIKYFAPLFFLAGYCCYAYGITAPWLIAGSLFIGIANGVGIPYLNTIASIKGGKESATTVMPLLSAALYLGQFISPLIVSTASSLCFGVEDIQGPYKIANIICILFLLQAYLTRKAQFLPPEGK
ncbi:MAG: MFS transporter [Bacteroidales bacterium]|nr:MFS transporter [Bacteroidales bacterium]